MTNGKNTALYIAVVAVFTAMLSGGKFALMAIPNVEVVTILVALFSAVWGWKYSIPATIIFVILEMFLWGFNTWVLEYLIHWPFVAMVFGLLGKVHFKSNAMKLICFTACAMVVTFLLVCRPALWTLCLPTAAVRGSGW